MDNNNNNEDIKNDTKDQSINKCNTPNYELFFHNCNYFKISYETFLKHKEMIIEIKNKNIQFDKNL